MPKQVKPNPGSNEALILNCSCPVLDNAHGRGVRPIDGKPQFWIDGGCPLHGLDNPGTEGE